jgi:hypothetical protein
MVERTRDVLWFDRDRYDVLRVDIRLTKPFLIPLPEASFGVRPAIESKGLKPVSASRTSISSNRTRP